MRRLSPELLEATRHIDVVWDAEREARALAGMGRLRRSRARRRVVLVGVVALLVVGLGVRALLPGKPPVAFATRPVPVADPPRPAPSDDSLRIGERSRALPEPDAGFERGDGQRASLRQGHARFIIDEDQPLRIAAGSVILEARAARFSVAVDRRRVDVKVDEGHVLVLDGERRTKLEVGDASFPAQSATPPERPAPARVLAPVVDEPTPVLPPHRSWRELAAEGDYDRAHAALVSDPRPPADATQLLLAADVARLSHHPAEALAPLHKILDEHATDPRAQLAAFTLGRVLLDELGRPSEAAQAFARAEALAPRGPLSEDAVAREIEAWSRAGETTRARELAEAYLRRFPDGRRARSVRRFGGLD